MINKEIVKSVKDKLKDTGPLFFDSPRRLKQLSEEDREKVYKGLEILSLLLPLGIDLKVNIMYTPEVTSSHSWEHYNKSTLMVIFPEGV